MPRYWFRQKTFGYGFTPNTWQGWLFILVFLVLALGLMFGTDHVVANRLTAGWIKVIGLIALIVPFLWIGLAKTKPDRS